MNATGAIEMLYDTKAFPLMHLYAAPHQLQAPNRPNTAQSTTVEGNIDLLLASH
jgi:hypothetical protein